MITTTALTKSYDKVPVVRDVSLHCEPGTITGFLGANGAGQVHDAEDDRRAGATRSRHGDHRRPTVRRAAQPDPRGRDAARRVGDAPRAQWPGDAHDRRAAGRRVHTRRVEHLLDLVGIDRCGGRSGSGPTPSACASASAIAQALVGEPEALILDEPANGLDPEGIAWMRTLLRDFADRGGTVLLSSHLLHEVQATADHLVVISGGAVVAAGRLDDLLASSTHPRAQPRPRCPGRARSERRGSTTSPGRTMRFTVDVSGGRVTTEVVAGVARDHQVLLTELRQSETNGLEQLFFSLTAAKAAPPQEAAA